MQVLTYRPMLATAAKNRSKMHRTLPSDRDRICLLAYLLRLRHSRCSKLDSPRYSLASECPQEMGFYWWKFLHEKFTKLILDLHAITYPVLANLLTDKTIILLKSRSLCRYWRVVFIGCPKIYSISSPTN